MTTIFTMPAPDAETPSTPTTSLPPFAPLIPDFSIERGQFNQILENRGVRFMHYRALPCPNINGLDQNSHDPLCPHCDSNNIIYYRPKEIFGHFSGNATQKQFEFNGVFESSTAVVTLPSEYSDGEQADFSVFDKLVAVDFMIQTWEKKEYVNRPIQQLRYPILQVEYMVTATSSILKEYFLGIDFNIIDGKIEWISGRAPSYDSLTDTGQTFSVRYLARPAYIVANMLRELRVSQQVGLDGVKRAVRLPQQLVVKRDFWVNPSDKVGD